MSAPAGRSGPDDAQLVAGVLAGDRDAFAAVYDRYGDRLHDFCHSLLRSREDAADPVADTFVIAAERMGQLRDPDRLRPWLYAIARSEGLRRLRARKRFSPDSETALAGMADAATGPEAAAEQAALRDLVWNAAAGLADRDRVLLDLHLRHGLDGADLGEAVGVTAQHAYVLLNRLRAQVERSIGALLVARLGRADCAGLDGVLAGWDGGFSPLVRKRVARHVDSCEVCSDRRRRVVSPWALIAAVPLVPAPPALRDRVIAETRLVAHSGPPPAAPRTATRAAVAAAVAAALVVGAVVLLRPSGPAETAVAATPAVASQAPAPPPAPTPVESPTPPARTPGSLVVSTGSLDLGGSGRRATVRLSNTGDGPLPFSVRTGDPWLDVTPPEGSLPGRGSLDVLVAADRAALPEGGSRGRVTVEWAGGTVPVVVTLTEERPPVVDAPRPGGTGCEVPVRVAVSDDSGLESVTLRWEGPDGEASTAPMAAAGDGWSGRAGPFPVGGEVVLTVTAVDVRGNSATGPATRTTVDPCPQ